MVNDLTYNEILSRIGTDKLSRGVEQPSNDGSLGRNKEGYFQITQWFPKPGVFDKNGWHPLPYLDLGEFYSEFGNYEVAVTVPNGYVVAATGEHLQNSGELPGSSTFNFKAENVLLNPDGSSRLNDNAVLLTSS